MSELEAMAKAYIKKGASFGLTPEESLNTAYVGGRPTGPLRHAPAVFYMGTRPPCGIPRCDGKHCPECPRCGSDSCAGDCSLLHAVVAE